MQASEGAAEHVHPLDPDRVAQARGRLPSRADTGRLAELLALIADPTRARLMYALDVVDELCVGDLALALDLNQDAVSYGLRVLRGAGLVTFRRAGRVLYYRLADGFPEALRTHCLPQLVEMSRSGAPDGDVP